MIAPAEISSRVVVPMAPERVWQAVVDWTRQRHWMLGTRVHGGHGLGAELSARTGIGPVGFTDPMVITEWDPPRRCVMRHTGRVVRGTGVFEVTPAPGGCEFRWAEQLELPFAAAGRLGWQMVRPLAQRGMDISLRRFARLICADGLRTPSTQARPRIAPGAGRSRAAAAVLDDYAERLTRRGG